MKQGNWIELENVAAPYDADYRSSGFEPDDVRPTPEATKPQLRRMQDEAPRIRFPGEPHSRVDKPTKVAKSHSYGNFGLGVEFVPGDRSGIYTCVIPNKRRRYGI